MNIDGALPPFTATHSQSKQSDTTDSASNDKLHSGLSEQDQQQIQKLKARDQVVRAHEAAHLAAGAGVVSGGANFTFQRGPNGVQYAIGGEVSIDTSEIAGNPEATLRKAEQIRAAALAPAQPSSQDIKVAAKASQMAIEARAEIAQQRRSENTGEKTSNNPFTSSSNSTGNLLDLTV
ncbi:MAG: putative metalloprotease CJM1_0395 family protein [Gammaproteobacteria bacterium]|nr:putative metalloprotease CJM1_0395 family protein [Gammaproteobacteria bacterium]MDH5591923.1 putative metalloprotease CJM1_0395 family protein [Gammaproteobacteria bacterium]